MTTRQRKLAMMIGAAAVCVAGVALLGRAFVLPVQVPTPLATGDATATPVRADAPGETGPTGVPPLDQLRALAGVDLRRPLVDPPEAVVQQPAAIPLQAQLVGTVNEHDGSMAIFTLADGTLAFCGVDHQFDDPAGRVTVKDISAQTVTVEYAGTTQQLVTPQ